MLYDAHHLIAVQNVNSNMKDAIFKFNETPGLGNAVRKIIPFCKLMPDMKLLPANSKT